MTASDPTPANSADEDLVTNGYDAVYATGPDSPTLQRLWLEHASGPDDPPEFGHISFLTAGLQVETYEETEGWQRRLTAAFQAVLDEAEPLTRELGERGYASLSLEVSITLGIEPYRRRILAVAAKP